MSGSIGSMLASFATAAVQRTVDASSGSSDFAAQLDASFRARAERLGLELPPAATQAADTKTPSGETVDEIWKRAQLMSVAAGNGPGDAMMQAIGEASDRRWAQRMHRDAPDLFDI